MPASAFLYQRQEALYKIRFVKSARFEPGQLVAEAAKIATRNFIAGGTPVRQVDRGSGGWAVRQGRFLQ